MLRQVSVRPQRDALKVVNRKSREVLRQSAKRELLAEADEAALEVVDQVRGRGPDVVEDDAARVYSGEGGKLLFGEAAAEAGGARPALQVAAVEALVAEIVVAVDDVILLVGVAWRNGLHFTDRDCLSAHVDRSRLRRCDRKLGEDVLHLLVHGEGV